ncbi:MAG: hypothetical protein NT042_14570 [Sulfuritalea sp.]|nr:hypothetical protein [Sulfuritalea sp.]
MLIATDKVLSGGRQDQTFDFHPKVSSRSTDKDYDGGLDASLKIKGEPKLMSVMTSLS